MIKKMRIEVEDIISFHTSFMLDSRLLCQIYILFKNLLQHIFFKYKYIFCQQGLQNDDPPRFQRAAP